VIDKVIRTVRDVATRLDLPSSLARKIIPENRLINIRIKLITISVLIIINTQTLVLVNYI